MLALSLSLLGLLPALALAGPIQKRYSGVLIQANRDGKCLSVSGNQHAAYTDGSGVFSVDCSMATTWDLNPGSGSILAHNVPQFALDAGSTPGNNGALKIWTSYPGLYQQTWYLTDDQRIAITGGNQCLDEGDNGIQTYQCTTGNTNQVFNIVQPGGVSSSAAPSSTSSTPSSTSSSAQPSATGSFSDIPVGTVFQDPSGGGRRIHPNGRSDLCVSVLNGNAFDGQQVGITYCLDNNDPNVGYQLWDLPNSGNIGAVQLHSQNNFCLDAGDNPANGSGAKIWTCYDGLLQQTWDNVVTNVLSLSNNQCLDVTAGSTGVNEEPYSWFRSLQTWECSNNGDPQQVFYEISG